MANEIFIAACCLLTVLLFRWAFRHLPQEQWQFIASIPRCKGTDNCWQATNLTYYGFFNATAYTLSCTLVIVLTAAIGIPLGATLALLALVLGICMPGSRIVARVVEKKPHTFSIGGAFFIGLVATPFLLLGLQPLLQRHFQTQIDPVAFLAAVAIAYCWGEGIGRLACISFGCCYGKPIAALHPMLRMLFRRWHFIFFGATRKIAYAHHLEGVQVVPVQAITAVLYSLTAIAGIYAFLHGAFRSALLLSLLVTQLWRFASEFLRADYRGQSQISAYQYMSLLAAVLAVGLAYLLPAAPAAGSITILTGLRTLWHPGLLLALQVLWVAVFIYTGKSAVTGATIQFHVRQHLT
jgi:hypothetical protein